MKVVLAGYNTDVQHGSSTPETLSAAYARISRDPRPIEELRAESAKEVERARESNRRIVFGYGHGSVAEHAFFNFDILGLSRLATEALQLFRLASFTEKSQRYITLDPEWVVPPELPRRLAGEWDDSVGRLFELYSSACRRLEEAGLSSAGAREDARYLLPLAALGQMGMSLNARELEHMIRRLSAHPLEEVRRLSQSLLSAAEKVAPSLLRHLEPSEMDRLAWRLPGSAAGEGPEEVSLVDADSDEVVGARLLQRESGEGIGRCRSRWKGLSGDERRKRFDRVLRRLGPHDAPPRDWELAGFSFELLISATAYAQLKRHRMTTQLVSQYAPELGLRLPPSFERAGMQEMLQRAAEAHRQWSARLGGRLADYLLTNAHRRRVVIRLNARELYHLSRLRMDSHAQWDIRELAGKMVALAGRAAPMTLAAAGPRSSVERGPEKG